MVDVWVLALGLLAVVVNVFFKRLMMLLRPKLSFWSPSPSLEDSGGVRTSMRAAAERSRSPLTSMSTSPVIFATTSCTAMEMAKKPPDLPELVAPVVPEEPRSEERVPLSAMVF